MKMCGCALPHCSENESGDNEVRRGGGQAGLAAVFLLYRRGVIGNRAVRYIEPITYPAPESYAIGREGAIRWSERAPLRRQARV